MYGGGNMSLLSNRTDRRGKRAELPDDIAKKLKSCSVLNCEEWRDLTSYTTYHCFPTGEKNQDRWEIWTQLLRKAREDETWIPFRGSLVCSHHFRPEDFVNDPLSKRRKLIKNAIPSVFPSFTVDLDDPSYQIADDQTGDGNEDSYGNDESGVVYAYATADQGSMLINDVGDDGYEYEYPETDEMVDNSDANHAISGTLTNLQTEEEEDDDDIQIILPAASSQVRNGSNASSSRNNLTAGQIILQQQRNIQLQPSQLITVQSNKITVGNGSSSSINLTRGATTTLQSRSVTSSNGNLRQQPRLVKPSTPSPQIVYQKPPPLKRSREEETAKALSNLPFALNPDLEIEMIDPTEDLAAYRLRISELEHQNKTLVDMYENAMEAMKQKYENQILILRKRVKEQERLLLLNQISIPSNKKIRLS